MKPLSAQWPDTQGRFTLILPRLAAGTVLRFWESDFMTFSSTAARPGGAANPNATPARLTNRIPSGVAVVRVG